MTLRTQGFALLAAALLATSASAQTTFPEVEPNSVKPEADLVTGIAAGDAITGTTTGVGVAAGDTALTSSDVFRVKTAALPLGIYRHQLTLSTSTATGHTGTIRGLNQTGTAGTASTGGTAGTVDSIVQTSLTTTVSPPPRSNQWYGFGKQEEFYYRVQGTTATTAAYAATMSTATVPFTVIAPAFEASAPITISTVGLATVDTDIHVYDIGLNALPGFDNDDEAFGTNTAQSRITRTFAPGSYFVAVGNYNVAWNFVAPPDEDFQTGILMDFPDILVTSSTTPTTGVTDRDLAITGCNGTFQQSNQVTGPDSFSIQWFLFTVANGAPAISSPSNDNCAAAMPFSANGSHTTKLSTATNDGAASCDPGGPFSRDVWYSFTAGPIGGTLGVSTCGTTMDTCVSIHNTCGGADVLCNDDCGGAPCASTASCLSGVLLSPNQVVLVRVSDKGLGGCADVTTAFTFVPTPPTPPVNDDCNTPIVLPGPGTYPFDTTAATTGTQGQGGTVACATLTSVKKDLWYTYTAGMTGTVTFSTCGLITSTSDDTKISYFAGAGCPAAASPIGCDDDSCATPALNTILTFPITCGGVFTMQVGNYSPTATVNIVGSFSVVESGTTCSLGVVECIGDTVAACPCSGGGGSGIPNPGAAGNGCANSSFPAGAHLTGTGNAVDNAGDTFVLTCSNMPGPGLFFQSNGLAGPIVNFNDGVLCAAIGIIRMGVVFPTAGVASYPGGLTPNPIHIAGGPVLLGGSPTAETKHYQCWYRDITPGFCNVAGHNMSNGLAVVWAP